MISIILVEFENYCGRIIFDENPKLVQIIRIGVKKGRGERNQFPIIQANGISIHKSRGSSLDSAYVNIGLKEFAPGLTFVALSRVKSIENLYLKPFSFERFQELECASNTRSDRLAEEERLNVCDSERKHIIKI